VVVSVDTTRAVVAEAALDAGASIVNDVSGAAADPRTAPLAARRGCRLVLMHWRDHSADMYARAEYDDVVAEVRAELSRRVDAALSAGVAAEQIIVDPGLGFAKLPRHNWTLSAHLDAFVAMGFPVLFGGSRKSYLGKLLADADGTPRPADERDAATLATSVLAFEAGVWGVRVHDVRATADARAVWEATRLGRVRQIGARDAD
ncbi:MAG: dihydropteroate synthase, partial [Stackebrandtia sp.]